MAEDAFRFCDDLGPKSSFHIYEPKLGLKAILVVDNVATGPSIGGLRMAPDVSLEECFRLARAMTLKNAAAGLPHGGGKAVMFGDPAMSDEQKERCVRALANAIAPIEDFIPGPDMGTNETVMAWVLDEIGRAVGLPRELGGIPLDEIGATGFGLSIAADVAQSYARLDIAGARVAVQGFGSVGKHAALKLGDKGAKLVAAADSSGTVYDPGGLDTAALIALKRQRRHLRDFEGAQHLDREAVIAVDCDILIPAARPDAVNEANADAVKAKLVVQGANIGVTEQAEASLDARGIVCIPDFISNAGGVICASVEYHGGSQAQALAAIEEKIRANTSEVLERAAAEKTLPRAAASRMALERIRRAVDLRRWS
jgi:glutamate dehydrogenase (NAD(P)+)